MTDPISWKTLLEVGAVAVKERETAVECFIRIQSLLFGKRSRVAITGMKGIGKTTLLDFLSSKGFEQGYEAPTKQSVNTETVRLRRKLGPRSRIILTSVPGDNASHAKQRAFYNLFDHKRPVDGVVHVVADGLSTIRNSVSRAYIIKEAGASNINAVRHYLRKQEIAELHTTLNAMRQSITMKQKPSWMLVAVTKSDLLADKIEDVEKYYSPEGDSEFVNTIRTFQSSVGGDFFEWNALPVASALEDYRWETEVLSPLINIPQRDRLLMAFAQILESYCAREAK